MSIGSSSLSRRRLQEIDFDQSDFDRIKAIARRDYGLSLIDSKKTLVRSRLIKRIQDLGLFSFSSYCDRLEAKNSSERDHFITALTTNVTHFYREAHHFDFLEDTILPPLLDQAEQGQRIRIWSAGCSSGQEPVSIAGSIVKVIGDPSNLDICILATDVDPTVLKIAEEGKYPIRECQIEGADRPIHIFEDQIDGAEFRQIKNSVLDLISYQRINLKGEWSLSESQDIIFCRNVAIYFDSEFQDDLWCRFSDQLKSGGYLVIGHSERIMNPDRFGLKNVGITTYRKT